MLRFLLGLSCGLILLVAPAIRVRAADGDAKKHSDAKKSSARIGVIELSGSYPEGAGTAGLFSEVQPSLSRLFERLDQAAHDKKLAGVLLEIRDPELGRGKIHELRVVIDRLRKAGKKVYADLRSADSQQYLIASACDEIVMPESGTLAITGVRAEITFYKDLLDKLGVKAEIMQMGAFKGTGEPYTRNSMSPEFHKQLESLIDDVFDQFVDGIAADRKLDRGHVKDLIDKGIFTATEAKEAGLIDRVAYRDMLLAEIARQNKVDEVALELDYGKKKLDTDFSGFNGFVKMVQMLMGGEPAEKGSNNRKIAVIYVVGEIVDGKGSAGIFESESIGGDTLIKAITQAEKDPKVAAIVLRIDSPGGSALASDLVWRSVVSSKKPVVTSMGNVAASGGFYIAMGSKKIFAEPGTVTGSIGVVGGKIALAGLFNKLGVKTESISRGKNAGWLSSVEPFSPSEREAWLHSMQDMYRQFTTKAAEGRKLDLKHLRDDLAGGRVFTGRVAVGNKLVDKVGTLDDAVAEAKSLAGMKADEPVDRLLLPKPKSFLESMFGDSDMDTQLPLPAGELRKLTAGLRDAEMFRRVLSGPAVVLPYRLEIR
jgi:protease-4